MLSVLNRIASSWFELPMSQTNFHGPKEVRAIEVQLYVDFIIFSVCFVIVPHFYFFWCLGKAVLRYFGVFCVYSHVSIILKKKTFCV